MEGGLPGACVLRLLRRHRYRIGPAGRAPRWGIGGRRGARWRDRRGHRRPRRGPRPWLLCRSLCCWWLCCRWLPCRWLPCRSLSGRRLSRGQGPCRCRRRPRRRGRRSRDARRWRHGTLRALGRCLQRGHGGHGATLPVRRVTVCSSRGLRRVGLRHPGIATGLRLQLDGLRHGLHRADVGPGGLRRPRRHCAPLLADVAAHRAVRVVPVVLGLTLRHLHIPPNPQC